MPALKNNYSRTAKVTGTKMYSGTEQFRLKFLTSRSSLPDVLGLYDCQQDRGNQTYHYYTMVYTRDDGSLGASAIDEDRAKRIAKLLDGGTAFEAARLQTRKPQ